MKYNFKKIEKKNYYFWEKNKFFKTIISNKNKNYCIILPPPNITGSLHIGHSFQHVIMDFLIRYNRMNKKNTLWQPGIDHAGIATQIFIENKYNKKLYNKKFLIKKTKIWKNKLSKYLINQMKILGNSIYWPYMRYTFDKNYQKSVKEVFIKLYNENLIYKNKYIINWDPKLKTAISDLEVTNVIKKRKIWYIKLYILENNINTKKYIIIRTSKPERILEITAIFSKNTTNIFKKNLSKYKILIPIINNKIPIFIDKNINTKNEFGYKALIPSMSSEDYKIAIKNNIPIIIILKLNNKVNKKIEFLYIYNKYKKISKYYDIPSYLKNLNIKKLKEKILEKLKKLNLIFKEEYSNINLLYNNRNKSYIENIITDQWYIKTKLLVNDSLELIINKNIKFIQDKYKNIYMNYIKNIEDWCISRQIWWGHRIPIWYDIDNNEYVGLNKNDIINKYNLNKNIKLFKEKDVLDTWFSSSICTFSFLNWPKKNNKKIKYFHPTNLIISGHDIIFFWILRMIIITNYVFKKKEIKFRIPFKKIYITGLINDENGKKMSKSNGNVIDPIDIIKGISFKDLIKKNYLKNKENINKIIKKFPNGIKASGSDSIRLAFLSYSKKNKNINFDIKKVYFYKNFCNKIWNSSIFIMKNCKNFNKKIKIKDIKLIYNKYIISKFNKVIKNYLEYINNYQFDKLVEIIIDFFWKNFCNWNIEISKYFFIESNNYNYKNEIRFTLIFILNEFLKLIHPISPFITEEIWQIYNKKFTFLNKKKSKTITLEKFPRFSFNNINNKVEKEINIIKSIITLIRKYKLIYKKLYIIILISKNSKKKFNLILENLYIIKYITKIKNINIINHVNKKYKNIYFYIDKNIYLNINYNINIY